MSAPTRRTVDPALAAIAVLGTILAAGTLIHPQLAPLLAVTIAFGGLILNGRKESLDRQRFSVERFKAPIEHLDADRSGLRMAGVWELKHIMAFSDTDQNTAVALLCGFVRDWTVHGDGQGPAGQPSLEIGAAIETLRTRRRLETEAPLDLTRARLPRVLLPGVHLAEARLSRIDLTDADLRGAILSGADLTRANLSNAILAKADLRGARLVDARCAGTDLTDADLRGADLTETLFVGADLRGADLRDTIGLTPTQLADAHVDARTRLPWS